MTVAPRADNAELASLLERIATLLETQRANPFRVSAYRRAANTVRTCPESVTELFAKEGIDALEQLPCIGHGIAGLVREYARSGHISLLDRLSGAVAAEEMFAAIPGVGPTFARRIHDTLGIETLEELECACHDGRLAALPGFGARRVAAIRASLDAVLGGEARRRAREGGGSRSRPPVGAVLWVDREYRRKARAGELVRITPRRFNPERRAWLPILHIERDGWAFTALYSNTARAHRLGKTGDWVVVHADRNGEHDQCTVVTERHGGSERRVIRGRELECEAYEERSGGSRGAGAGRGGAGSPARRPFGGSPLEDRP